MASTTARCSPSRSPRCNEVVSEAASLFAGPGVKCSDELPLLDQAVLQRQNTEEQVARRIESREHDRLLPVEDTERSAGIRRKADGASRDCTRTSCHLLRCFRAADASASGPEPRYRIDGDVQSVRWISICCGSPSILTTNPEVFESVNRFGRGGSGLGALEFPAPMLVGGGTSGRMKMV